MISYDNLTYEEIEEIFNRDGSVRICLGKIRAAFLLNFITIFANARNPGKEISRIRYILMCLFGVFMIAPMLIFGNKLFSVVSFFYKYHPKVKKYSLRQSNVEILFSK